MEFNEIDNLIINWKLADAKTKITTLMDDLSEEQTSRLSEKIRLYEECDSHIKIAAQSTPSDGFQQLKNYPNLSLLKSHNAYDSVYQELSEAIKEQIDSDIADAIQEAGYLNFENARSLLENAENLGNLLGDPNKLSQVQKNIEQINKEEESEDLINKIYDALNTGNPTKGFDYLHQLEALGVKDLKEIEKLRTELAHDETHRMGQSTKHKASTEYENIINVRKSLEESTKYRLKYNAEIRYIDLAEARKEYLEKELKALSSHSTEDIYRSKLETELTTINEALPKSRKLSAFYAGAAVKDVREKVNQNIEAAQNHLEIGNYNEASQSLDIAKTAGKSDEKFAGFVEDRMSELPLEDYEIQKITEIENKLATKQKKRFQAEISVDRAKTLLSQNNVELADITRVKHDLDGIFQEDPSLPGLSIIIRKVQEKINSIEFRKRALLEIEIRSLTSQWKFDNTQIKLNEIKALCAQKIYQELEDQFNIQKENQHSANLYNAEFERSYQEKLDSVESDGFDDLKTLLGKWKESADHCETEIIKVMASRKELDKFIKKSEELSRNKKIIEQVLHDLITPNAESDSAGHSLASSIVRDRPAIISLITRYWIKVADGISEQEPERKLKVLQNASAVARNSHDNQLSNLVNGKIKDIQNRTAEGQYANRILEQLNPLLEGVEPDLQEAGRVLATISSDHPIRLYPSIMALIDKKEKLTKNQDARNKYDHIRSLIDNNEDLEKVIKTLDEILMLDPDNLEYKRALVRAQFKKDDEYQLEQKINYYLENVNDISKLDEIEVFLKGLDKQYSATIRNKKDNLQNKVEFAKTELNKRFDNFEEKVNTFVNNNQFEEAKNALESKNIIEFHPNQYIKFGNLKAAVENKIELAISAGKKITDAETKAASANFTDALRDLAGLSNWKELPEQKKLEIKSKQDNLIEYERKYRSAESDLDEMSEMMRDLKISFKLQMDVSTKQLIWNGEDDAEVKVNIQRTNMELKKMNLPVGLPKNDPVLNSYECLSLILDCLDAIEQSSPKKIPDDRENRKTQLTTLNVKCELISKEIQKPLDNIKLLLSHRNTSEMLNKCIENKIFREAIYKIKDDLESETFLALLTGKWKKHTQNLQGIKTLYHFHLAEVDNE